MWPSAVSSSQVTYATWRPSGDHTGRCSPTSSLVSRIGVPSGRSATYTRSSAVKASRLPSGEVRAKRICLTVKVGVSSIGYSNSTSGPIAISASTVKGISTGSLPSTGTRQIRPP